MRASCDPSTAVSRGRELPCKGFVAHSLLPMEQDDIRAFIRHWHDAARAECLSDHDRAQLDTYEGSLRQAVGMCRDLGRPATNPSVSSASPKPPPPPAAPPPYR